MADVTVPELAESISEASVESWLVGVGDAVTAGQVIVNIETDKVLLEVPAPESGVITEIVKDAGADVTSNEVLARLDTSAAAAVKQPAKKEKEEPAPAAEAPKESQAAASPAARKIASELNVDLQSVTGTGKDGRITKEDIQHAAQDQAPAQPAAPAPPPPAAAAPPEPRPVAPAFGTREENREKMSKLRARVAARLLESQRETAMLTTFNEVDMSAIIELRKKYRDEFEKRHGVKLGIMSFFVQAAAAALQQYPVINARIDGDSIVYHQYCDIGIAVGSKRGLVVPCLRNAENMTAADIEAQIADFGQRAQAGGLTVDELTGGTFTITNGGVFGSMLSTPIINPPQSAILGVHATKERPVAINGAVEIRPMNYLALSYDHRLIDGRDAVLFLVAVKNNLEDPARLALNL